MEFDFDDLLRKGHEAAEIVIRNNFEIDNTLNSLARSISNYINIETSLTEEVDYVSREGRGKTNLLDAFINKVDSGYKIISVQHTQTKIKKELFRIKKGSDGYPITINFGKATYFSSTLDEFREAIGDIISNSETNLALRVFKNEVLHQLKKDSSSTSE